PEKRAILASKGRNHVIAEYSLEQMAERTLRVYAKALKRVTRNAV
ncbi:MAG TPA: glycosyl transferase, partial [Thalassospira sp.]|nr:glycosyl transferase [Thalassospira sp.]